MSLKFRHEGIKKDLSLQIVLLFIFPFLKIVRQNDSQVMFRILTKNEGELEQKVFPCMTGERGEIRGR